MSISSMRASPFFIRVIMSYSLQGGRKLANGGHRMQIQGVAMHAERTGSY